MNHHCLLAPLIALVVCGCDEPSKKPVVVSLGGLHCEQGEVCQAFITPDDCARVDLNIDIEDGTGCLQCSSIGGIVRERCGNIGLDCQFGVKDGDTCTVCTYLNGTIVFNDCDWKDACEHVTCPPAPQCPENTIAENVPGSCCATICVEQCELTTCAPLDCPTGHAPRQAAGRCCPECTKSRCEADDECPEHQYCAWMPTEVDYCAPEPPCPIYTKPSAETCVGGEWVPSGYDTLGCLSAYVCLCPINVIDPDNNCENGFSAEAN